MNAKELFPLAENAPDRVKTPTGKSLSDLTVDGILAGDITQEDLAITPEALHLQAEIANSVGRHALAENFHRAAELVRVPQEVLMETYDMLRPGRSDLRSLLERAELFRREFNADRIAAFVEEAAVLYERRKIFTKRY